MSTPPDDQIDAEIRRRSRRGFLLGGAGMLLGVGGLRWLTRNPADAPIAPALRRILRLDESIARAAFGSHRLSQTYPTSLAREPRPNGTLGLTTPNRDWLLHIGGDGLPTRALTLANIQALPRTEVTTELRCVEGWSQVVSWAGAKFSDFLTAYADPNIPSPEYVALATPDGAYYVGLDLASMLHPQTLLCYDMNGAPLTEKHGAPLRLVVPVKYGIKSLKRLGQIRLTSSRPSDYWAENGYDYYAGF